MAYWAVKFLSLLSIVAALASVGETCTDAIVTEKMAACASSTGYDATSCASLDCYLACVESLLRECQQQAEFFDRDPLVHRVKTRVVCLNKEYYTTASASCQLGISCSIEDQLQVQVLSEEIVSHHQSGDYVSYKDVSCKLYELLKKCFKMGIKNDCTAPMAEYMTQFTHLDYSYSECQDPQNSPLFVQYGGELTCTTPTTEQTHRDVTSTSSQAMESTTTTTRSTENDNISTNVPSLTTSGVPEMVTTMSRSWLPAITSDNVVMTTEMLANLSSSGSTVQSTMATTSAIPNTCTPLAIAMRFFFTQCDDGFYYNDLGEARENCKTMGCRLQCFDEAVEDCDMYLGYLSKLAFRLQVRFVCNATASGKYEEVLQHDCQSTECFDNYWVLLYNETDFEAYCRYVDEVKQCELYHVTDQCPQHAADFLRDLFLVEFSSCNPEGNPYYDAFKNSSDYTCGTGSSRFTWEVAALVDILLVILCFSFIE